MITTNPFADLAMSITPAMMQGYVILMFLFVIGGTLLDVMHKKSAKYFFENSKKAQKSAKRSVSGGEKTSLAIKTVANEVLTSAEFANPVRRISHLFLMYGFILFIVTTAVLIFAYPTAATPAPTYVPVLWHLGALSVAIGGYWFWFFIRVDLNSEGKKWYDLSLKGDLFIVSLLATVTFALIWSATDAGTVAGWIAFALFIISSTILFTTVLWSKFAHMFFKPAAAFQKRVTRADGSQENLPDLGELTDPTLQARYPDIPEYMGTNPPNMGLGIKRESPNHY
jgi:hypothetical protein